MKKNNAIVLWRILFTYLIMLYHFSCIYNMFPWFPNGNGLYIITDGFFIISGFLLYMGYETNPNRYSGAWTYLWGRIQQILPYYMLSYIPYIIASFLTNGVKETLYNMSFHYAEFFALHGIGLNEGLTYMNNTTWYISVLFLASFLLFHGLKYHRKVFLELIGPVGIILIYSYLYRTYGNLNLVTYTEGFFCNSALMRGIMDMTLGIYSGLLYQKITEKNQRTIIYKAIGTFCFLFVIFCSSVYGFGRRDFMYILFLTFGVCFGFLPSERLFFTNPVLLAWANRTLSMYLLHSLFAFTIFPVAFDVPNTFSGKLILCLLYFVFTTITAILFDFMVKAFVKYIKRFY